MRKFLRWCGTQGYHYLETITERELSSLELVNRMLYWRHSAWFGSTKNRHKQCMRYIHTCGRHSFQGNSKNMEGKFCFKCSSQILLCVNCFMQNGKVPVTNFILKDLTSAHHIWVRFSPHLPLYSFINFYWRSYSLKRMSFLYLHMGPDVGISTLLSRLLRCTFLFLLKVKLENTTTTSSNDWAL